MSQPLVYTRWKELPAHEVLYLTDPWRVKAGYDWEAPVRRGKGTPMDPYYRWDYVYAIQARGTGEIKFGITGNVPQRFREIQAMNGQELALLLALIPGPSPRLDRAEASVMDLERALHQRFAAHRLRGEWFKPHAEVLEWIAAVAERTGWCQWRRAA